MHDFDVKDTKYGGDIYKKDGFQKYTMNKKCPVYDTMLFAGKRWTVLVLTKIYKRGKEWKRYSEIKRMIREITPKMLSLRLRELEKEGMIRKRADAKRFPVKTEYAITRKGEDFIDIIKHMKSWGLKWNIRNKYCKKVNCEECEI